MMLDNDVSTTATIEIDKTFLVTKAKITLHANVKNETAKATILIKINCFLYVKKLLKTEKKTFNATLIPETNKRDKINLFSS